MILRRLGTRSGMGRMKGGFVLAVDLGIRRRRIGYMCGIAASILAQVGGARCEIALHRTRPALQGSALRKVRSETSW